MGHIRSLNELKEPSLCGNLFSLQSFIHQPGKRCQVETDWPETDFKNLLIGFIIAAVTKGSLSTSQRSAFLTGRYGNNLVSEVSGAEKVTSLCRRNQTSHLR